MFDAERANLKNWLDQQVGRDRAWRDSFGRPVISTSLPARLGVRKQGFPIGLSSSRASLCGWLPTSLETGSSGSNPTRGLYFAKFARPFCRGTVLSIHVLRLLQPSPLGPSHPRGKLWPSRLHFPRPWNSPGPAPLGDPLLRLAAFWRFICVCVFFLRDGRAPFSLRATKLWGAATGRWDSKR